MREQEKQSDKEIRYITNLSKSVGKACDKWLAAKGLKGKSWKQQIDDQFKRKAR